MLSARINKKALFTFVIIAILIGLGSMGTTWKLGFAQTGPTIPKVTDVNPDRLCVNSGDVMVTLTGSKFINYNGDFFTEISWLGPTDVSPEFIEPDYINQEGTVLRFWVDSFRLTGAGDVLVTVVNHPELEHPFELATFTIKINHCIFLPIISK